MSPSTTRGRNSAFSSLIGGKALRCPHSTQHNTWQWDTLGTQCGSGLARPSPSYAVQPPAGLSVPVFLCLLPFRGGETSGGSSAGSKPGTWHLLSGCSKCCCSRTACALSFSTLRVQGLLSLPKLTRSPYGNSKHCPDTDHPKYTWHCLLHSRLPRPAPSTGSLWAFHGISRSRPPGTNFDSTPSLPHLGTSSKLDVILDPSVSHPHPLSGNTVGSTHNIEPGSAHLSLYSPTCSWAITAASSLPQLPTPPPPSVP